jgi:hypothetical protein
LIEQGYVLLPNSRAASVEVKHERTGGAWGWIGCRSVLCCSRRQTRQKRGAEHDLSWETHCYLPDMEQTRGSLPSFSTYVNGECSK